MAVHIDKNKLPLIVFLFVVLLFGAYHLFNSNNSLFMYGDKLAQGALPEDAIEPHLVTLVGEIPRIYNIGPNTQICPAEYIYCILYVVDAKELRSEVIAAGYSNAVHYVAPPADPYWSNREGLIGMLVGLKATDAAYSREYLGTEIGVCPGNYLYCRTITELSNYVLPYYIDSVYAGQQLLDKGGASYIYDRFVLKMELGTAATRKYHHYGYKASNVMCVLGSTKCEGNEQYNCERLSDDSVDWVSQGVCNDGKSCTNDICAGGECMYETIPGYCGTCETVDANCNCIPMSCIGVGGTSSGLGQQESRSCGNCGTETRTCSSSICGWTDYGACTGQGECAQDTSRQCYVSGVPGLETCSAYCSWGQCIQTGICVPNAMRCSGSTIQRCDGSGMWSDIEYCSNGCNAVVGQCMTCIANTDICDGTTLKKCSADGMSLQYVEQCAISCVNGACVNCYLGSTKCEGNERYVCEATTDGAASWMPQGLCNDNKDCTVDRCVSGTCRFEEIPDYCGKCETLDITNCNCLPMSCIGYGGIEYYLGQQETRSCGMCGTEMRTCSQSVCGWTDYGSCTNQGVCYPDTSRSCDISGIPGQQSCTQYCSWGTCIQTGECLPNTKRCSDNNAQKCDGSGNWQTMEYCTYGCNSATGDCNICTPTTIRCDSDVRQVCSGDGMNWQFVENCQYGCQNGMCLTCQIGTYRCNGDIKQACLDGYQWVDYTSCEYGCENSNCLKCRPDSATCEGNYLKTCTSNGLAWTQQYCQYGCDSINLKCDTMCTPMEKRCYSNTLQRCSTDGMTWSTIQACPYGCEDNACITPNCGDNPIPYTYSPVYCMASAGETCENCPEDCGYCPLSLTVQLDPTYITGKPAEVLVAVDGTSRSTVIKGKITLNDEVIHPEISSSTVNGVATLSFNVVQAGKFVLTVWATHPESMQQIMVTKNMVFESSLSMRMSYDDMQYLNEPVKAVVTITDSANMPVGVDTMAVQVTINGRPISCSPDTDCWEETGGGEYTILTDIPFSEGEGVVIITVTAGKAGYESITKSASFRVDKPGIQITFSEESPPAYAKIGKSVDVKIYVSSPQDDLFDADSVELVVTMPNGQTETLKMSRVTKGTYVTGYKFEQLELHTFKVTVRKTGFETTSKEKNTSVDPGASPIDWIPSLWTIITGIILFGLAYLVYIAVRKKK